MIMAPNIQGRVNIRSTDPLSTEQYYQLFLNVLEAQGYAVIPLDNGALKIVRSSQVKTEPIPVISHKKSHYVGDEMITQVITVQNISAHQLMPVLRQLIDRGGSGNIIVMVRRICSYCQAGPLLLTGCFLLSSLWIQTRINPTKSSP